MSSEKYQNTYRIKSARATWHDYSGGAYFITVCTKKHEHYFGEIHNVETWRAASYSSQQTETRHATSLQMTKIGQFLHDNLQNVSAHYSYAEIPLFVVMPNHWHAIIFIDGDKTPYNRDAARHVSTTNEMQNIANMQGWLSVTVGGIKSAVTKFANENGIDFAWQTRFHDHIIRNQNEMNLIADYIENNPETWDADCFNGKNRSRDAARHVSTNKT